MRWMCLPVLALFLTGCDDLDVGILGPYRQDFQYSYPLTPGGKVELENFNGSVEISGWDKDTVDIHGTKYAGTEQRLKDTRIDVTPSPDSITIRTVPPVDRFGHYGVQYVIRVPRRSELANIASSNGAIRVDMIDGHVSLKTSNGRVRASQIQGFLEVQTSNGGVEVTGISGDTELRTSNGSINAELAKGGLRVRTSNGGIEVRLRGADDRPIRLESSNGHIDLAMDVARAVHASTSNSSITVHMPESVKANVRAQTSNASITSDFDVNVHGGSISKHRLEGTIGSGGPLLDLVTSNGRIKLERL